MRCRLCGKRFLPSNKNVKYCSIGCYNKFKKVIDVSKVKIDHYVMTRRKWKQMWTKYHQTRDKNIYSELIAYMYNEEYYNNKEK
jgi:hypothetical protein